MVVQRLFGAFFTTKSNGMGITLRMARSIMENHGGRVWATRDPDSGPTLLFELPMKEHAKRSE
jgi:signal transduction histidine kinase